MAVAFASAVSAFSEPAYSTVIPLLIEKKHFDHANGMLQGAEGLAQLMAPVIAGILVVTIKIRGVLLIDCVTFLFALITLLIIRVPKVSDSTLKNVTPRSLLREVALWLVLYHLPCRAVRFDDVSGLRQFFCGRY